MSDKRTFNPGRLIQAVFGISRGILVSDWSNASDPTQVSLTTWDSGNKRWISSSQGTVTAYAGLPFTDTIVKDSVVWMVYLYKTYFIVLASC